MLFRIESCAGDVADTEITQLLTEAYLNGGFTTPERAEKIFVPAAVRARGELITPRDSDGVFVGMVIVVRPNAPARRMAEPDEAEIHLLAVALQWRRHGLGRQLMEMSLEVIRRMGLSKVLLWTQPTMIPAHRLYESLGFERAPSRDPFLDGTHFLVYAKSLANCGDASR